MTRKRERTAEEVLDAIARTEAEYQEIERIANASDEEIAKTLAEHGLTPDDARARMRQIVDAHAPPAKVVPLRGRRGFVAAMLLAATFAAVLGAGVVTAIAMHDEPPPKRNEDPRPEPSSPPTAVVRGPDQAPRQQFGAGHTDCREAKPPFVGAIAHARDAGAEGDYVLVLDEPLCMGDASAVDVLELAPSGSIDFSRYGGDVGVVVDGTLRPAKTSSPDRPLAIDIKTLRPK
jgi:hypothetical protein